LTCRRRASSRMMFGMGCSFWAVRGEGIAVLVGDPLVLLRVRRSGSGRSCGADPRGLRRIAGGAGRDAVVEAVRAAQCDGHRVVVQVLKRASAVHAGIPVTGDQLGAREGLDRGLDPVLAAPDPVSGLPPDLRVLGVVPAGGGPPLRLLPRACCVAPGVLESHPLARLAAAVEAISRSGVTVVLGQRLGLTASSAGLHLESPRWVWAFCSWIHASTSASS